ncbi:MAG: PAS domain-containing protein [Candidatus Heimdallarchaeota archaeon]
MIVSSILFIDNDKRSKQLLSKYLYEILDKPRIVLCKKKEKLDTILENEEFDLVFINNELKWELINNLLNSLLLQHPHTGRIVFSYKEFVDLDAVMIHADSFIYNLENNLKRLTFPINIASTRALERQNLYLIQKDYRELLDNVPIGLYKTNISGKILTCNLAFLKLLGYDEYSDVLNKNITDFYIDKEQFSNSLKIFSAKSPYKRGRLQLRRKTGEKIWVEVDTKATYTKEMILLALHGSVKDITDQVELENELKDSNENMQLYLDSTDTYFLVMNKNQEIIFANERIAELYGLAKEELIGKNWFDFLFKDSSARQASTDYYNKLLSGQIDFLRLQEDTLKMADGSEKTIIWKNNYVKNKNGNIIAIIGSGTDITERKKVQQLLKENDEKYRKLVETSPNAILMTDIKGNILFANKQFITMHRYNSDDEIIGKNIVSFIKTKSIDRTFGQMNLKQFVEKPGFEEFSMIRKDGSIFLAEVNGSFLLNEQGKPTGLIIVSQDITVRKDIEQALLNSEKLYRTIFENTGTNMVVVDCNQSIVISNSQFEKYVNLEREEIVGKSWKPLVHPNDHDYLTNVTNDILISPESFPRELEFRVLGVKGYSRNVWGIADVIPNTLTAIISIHDVTEQKIMDEVKATLFDQIERNMVQFAILIDKIRNPLAVITGLADIIESTHTNEIIDQTALIDAIIVELDQRWLESINVREFLRNHL